ncbi:hypothetical protein FHT60_002983 [Novosphingobium sp. BK486]|nr:hypothetical protein [Novosphingobium sp. BK256]MBB3375360.1 hypothetical protein [Novosphingobium sp. BK280]MBB3379931.1 hypothetical protein [Novosphingobium sp. BK258]MBB3421626.1 hypothetical protein [Novosphingobium sp. BK267]MBB3449941.1 hypothetical protein [Novosphingobium sp. BK352]MBB3478634.1 hypothetical protein [Novosphingobium sp. BK369]MBB3501948.1 hypothetical protein [Novosphingobium sp. BK336]MBB3537891.1 hypothetical protein [Novosphingobium sp. BK486]MBB3557289.1 hypo
MIPSCVREGEKGSLPSRLREGLGEGVLRV